MLVTGTHKNRGVICTLGRLQLWSLAVLGLTLPGEGVAHPGARWLRQAPWLPPPTQLLPLPLLEGQDAVDPDEGRRLARIEPNLLLSDPGPFAARARAARPHPRPTCMSPTNTTTTSHSMIVERMDVTMYSVGRFIWMAPAPLRASTK